MPLGSYPGAAPGAIPGISFCSQGEASIFTFFSFLPGLGSLWKPFGWTDPYPGPFLGAFLLGPIFPWPGAGYPGLFANKYLYNYNDVMKYIKPYPLFEGHSLDWTLPNFREEWGEAKRYPQFREIGHRGWLALARAGGVVNWSSLADRIGNVDLDFGSLDPDKRARFKQAIGRGRVEIPIAVRFSDGSIDLLGGNTRLAGLIGLGLEPPIWLITLPQSITESADAGRLVELGLYDGPVIRWEVTARPDSWIDGDNPVIGRFILDPSPDQEHRDLLGSHDNWWTLYLSSFSASGSNLIEWHLSQLFRLADTTQWRKSPMWLGLLKEFGDQLGWALIKYLPGAWAAESKIAAYCINTREWSWCTRPIPSKKPIV